MKIYRLTLILLACILIFSCCPEPKELTLEELDKEKAAIVNVIKENDRAMEQKSFAAIIPTLASEVIFFGTDSSEVIKTFAEYKEAIQAQWNRYDKTEYGDLSDVSIQMDKAATLATIIYGIHVTLTKGTDSQKMYLRVSRTLKKEQGKWVIVSGIVGAVRPDEKKSVNFGD